MHTILDPDDFPGLLEGMKRPPAAFYARGNTRLLQTRRVSIVGSRNPTPYTRHYTRLLAAALSRCGVTVVSGAAMGVDAEAHEGAGTERTIAVLPSGIDVRYPAVNAPLIGAIESGGLTLSLFDPGFRATSWSFVVRNEMVVALGEVLVVTQADPDSGSMRSVEYAQAMGKKVYVLPQRLGESEGTAALLARNEAEAIYDIGAFASRFGREVRADRNDPLIAFCLEAPSYEHALAAWGARLYDYELEGKIAVVNGRVEVL